MGKHGEKCTCLKCMPSAEREEAEKKAMAKMGWYCHAIPSGDEDSPTGINYHTHGCQETFGHMDFQVVAGVPPQAGYALLTNLMQLVKNGSKFGNRSVSEEVIENMPIMLAEAQEDGRTVLRVIIPDKNGSLEEGNMEQPFVQQWAGVNPIMDGLFNPSLN